LTIILKSAITPHVTGGMEACFVQHQGEIECKLKDTLSNVCIISASSFESGAYEPSGPRFFVYKKKKKSSLVTYKDLQMISQVQQKACFCPEATPCVVLAVC
jgi:hypothetical protein